MKKKLLFVMNHLHCGGAEKALISLLETLDYSIYEVDLLLFKQEGLFMAKIPPKVRLLPSPPKYKYLDMPMKEALALGIRSMDIGTLWSRLLLTMMMRLEKQAAVREQRVWKFIKPIFPEMERKYDAAIGYLEKSPVYYVVDKTTATRKIGWIHTNYTNMGMDNKVDAPFFEKLDYVVTVSDECAKSLHDAFPDLLRKFKVIPNIVSPAVVRRLAESEEVPGSQAPDSKAEIHIVTVARLNHVKGIDLAIKACKRLIEAGRSVNWKVLGQGSDKEWEAYSQLIQEFQLQPYFHLIGAVENPYPYLKHADIYVQPSRFEGKSIAIDEAKIMGMPIVVTNYASVKDQIAHERNGLVVEMTPEAIAGGVIRLVMEPELRMRFKQELSKEKLGTEKEIQKLYHLITE